MFIRVDTSNSKGTILSKSTESITATPGNAVYEIANDAWPNDPSTGQPARKNQCYWNTDQHLPVLKTDMMIVDEYRKQKFLEIMGIAGTRDLWLIVKKNLTGSPNYNYDNLRAQAKTFWQNLNTDLTIEAIDTRCAAALQALGLDSDEI